jgi:hypothetical protein
MAKTETEMKNELKAKQKKFEAKQKLKIQAMMEKLETIKNAEFKIKAPKVKTLTATEFKKRVAEIASESEAFKKIKKPTIQQIAKWTDEIEPVLMSIIATAKQAKEKALENMDSPKDKRTYRRLIDKVEKTGLKAKDYLPAIKAQQNRIKNISEDIGDITKYLTK